jgi:hypothetical protein
MFIDFQVAFMMLSLCYAQWSIKLLTANCISITMSLVALYQVWCSYHSYVGKGIKIRIIWHHSGPFDSSLSHFSCSFRGPKPSFNGSTCYPFLLRMLGFDHFCIGLLFLVGWSLYSSWCDGTCRDQYLFLPSRTTIHTCVILPKVVWTHVFFFKNLVV